MSKHTPGPWRVEENTTLIWGDCNTDDHSTRGMGYPIAEARINPSGNWSTGPYADEGEANARLIAAAPDLLAAAKNLIDAHGDGSRYNERPLAFASLISAIAKAEGQP